MGVINTINDFFNWIVPVLDNVPIIRVIIGIVLIFFAPGFAWTLVLFKRITRLERLALSFALSLAIVTLSILGLNLVTNMRITGLNALLTILLLIIVPTVIFFTQKHIDKKKTQQTGDK